MYPYIHTPWGSISTFTLFAAVGVIAMLLGIRISLKGSVERDREVAFIYPRVVVSGMVGAMSAGLTDALFKFLKYGVLKPYGIAFYGGLIGGIGVLYILLRYTTHPTQYSMIEWFNKLTLPFVLFHVFGRVGCFFGGCCYGQYASGPFTLIFPDNLPAGIVHGGRACYPTQLFEVVALLGIAATVICVYKKFEVYLLSYAAARFLLEFLRGDDRGSTVLGIFSPAQCISIGIIAVWTSWRIKRCTQFKKQNNGRE